MLTEKSTTSSAGHIERPVIDAAHDIQVIDSPYVAPVVDAAQLSGDAPNPSDFNAVWSQVMDQVASGTLTSDSPELLRLVEHLKQTGVLPANAMMDSDALMQFHFWFSSMPMDSVSSVERVVLEGALLQAWGNGMSPPPLDQVVVFDALNAFDQYAVYCQVTFGDEVITLQYDQYTPVQYDPQAHRGVSILLREQWVNQPAAPTVDYTQAHEVLQLSTADQQALDQWLKDIFPVGTAGLSDDDIVFALMTAVKNDIDYRADLGDDWAPIKTILTTKSGDCEDVSHLFFAAVHAVYADLPDRQAPDVSVVAGVVGAEPLVFGHSVVQWNQGDATRVIDLLAPDVASVDALPLWSDFCLKHGFVTYFEYTSVETKLHVTADDLVGFSTSDGKQELNEKFQSVFGTDKSLNTVLSSNAREFTIDSYDALIQKVIAHELNQLKTTNNAHHSGVIDLADLETFDLYDFRGQLATLPGLELLTDADRLAINERLNHSLNFNQPLQPSDFSQLSVSQTVVYNALEAAGMIRSHAQLNGKALVTYHSVSQTPHRVSKNDLFFVLETSGVINSAGVIQIEALKDPAIMAKMASYFELRGSGSHYQRLVDLLNQRAFYFSTLAATDVQNEPLAKALSEFETLSEQVLNGLTAPNTPIYAGHSQGAFQTVSPYVIGGYQKNSDTNSLFVRINQQKLQQDLARLFTLQTKISAILTAVFSVSDMTSSIAAKLGEGASSASSSAKQRQKIVQSFNGYTSGLNQSINSLMDMFQTTIDKTNESRYQTALSKVDEQFAKVDKQLGDAFLGNEYQIRGERFKAQLQQDYYDMLSDNRKSMQLAMIDVPQFGANVMPSYFSSMLWDQAQDNTQITSMHLWSALMANGVIDEHGMISAGVDLATVPLFTATQVDQAPGLKDFYPTDDEAIRMKALIQEQFEQFLTRYPNTSLDKAALEANIRRQLQDHKSLSERGVGVVSMQRFNTSEQLHGVMDLMARESDDAVSIDFDALASSIDIESTHNTYGQKSYLTTSDLIPFQSSNPTFDLPETSNYKKYQNQISAALSTVLQQNTPITAETFSTIPAADRAGVLTALVDAGILNYYPTRSHYGIRYDYIKNHENTLTTTRLKQMLGPKSDDNPNGLGYIDNNSEIQSHAIDLTAAVPASVKGKLTDEQFRQLQRMMVNKQSGKTLHLSQAAAAIDEAGAGFQIANVDLINVARKNFMLMTMSRRVFMTLTSAYSKLFESLSKNWTVMQRRHHIMAIGNPI